MIRHQDAIRIARSLIGTPYSELDCINLIKKVIRDAPGGVKGYTTAGSNTLWRSCDQAAKYRDLTWRQEGLDGAKAGMLAFKAKGDDYHHVGIVTGNGTVIHSSSTQGGRGVVETELTSREGWTHLARHRYIEAAQIDTGGAEDAMESYQAVVALANPRSYLNVRDAPGIGGERIGKIYDGQVVTVQAGDPLSWVFVTYEGGSGYVDGQYLMRIDESDAPEEKIETTTMINELTGDTVMLVGRWRAAAD